MMVQPRRDAPAIDQARYWADHPHTPDSQRAAVWATLALAEALADAHRAPEPQRGLSGPPTAVYGPPTAPRRGVWPPAVVGVVSLP